MAQVVEFTIQLNVKANPWKKINKQILIAKCLCPPYCKAQTSKKGLKNKK